MRDAAFALAMVAQVSACSRRDASSNDASVAPSLQTTAVATASPLSTDARDAGTRGVDALDADHPDAAHPVGANQPDASQAGTIRLLVERVVSRQMMPGPPSASPPLLGYDLLAIFDPSPKSGRPTRIQPFCPPSKQDFYGMCQHFRTCTGADGGDENTVTCDGKGFTLVQHDGATFLKTADREISVRLDAPKLLAPSTRERTAWVEAP
jgi:hypothetical protein